MFEFTLIKELTKAMYQSTENLIATIFFLLLFIGVIGYAIYRKFFRRWKESDNFSKSSVLEDSVPFYFHHNPLPLT